MSAGTPERYERQKESIKSINMKPELHDQVSRYAAENGISVSQAIVEHIESFVSGNPTIKRRRRSRKISVWIQPQLWARFRARADREKITVTELIEHALEQM